MGGVKFKTNKEREEWEEEQKVRGQLLPSMVFLCHANTITHKFFMCKVTKLFYVKLFTDTDDYIEELFSYFVPQVLYKL